MKTGKAGLLGVVIGSMFATLLSPAFSEKEHCSEAASVVSHSIYKGDSIKIKTVVNQSKLSSAKKKLFSKLVWKSKNKKIVKISSKKIKAVKIGTTKVIGYLKKVTKRKVVKKDKKTTKKVTKYIKKITIRVSVVAKPSLTRMTLKGAVKGKKTASNKAIAWYGIPYGATTAGANRWKAPRAVVPWTGTKDTTVQKPDALNYSSTDARGYTGTEDCLYVNVHRPYTNATNLPVLVFLHGGGNIGGSANVGFDEMAAAMGVVIVSVSYREGAFGFLSHPALRDGTTEENSGNFMLLDIREALRWVRYEIGAFGGNPMNVTLSGFSAGARNTLMCLISPIMKGLFQKAFVMSGGYTTSTPKEGQESIESKLASLLVKRGTYGTKMEALSYIKDSDNATIRKLFMSLSTAEVAAFYKSFKLNMEDFPQGFTDGYVLPKNGFEVIRRGAYNRVPIMLGSDITEFGTFGRDGSLTQSDADLSDLTVTGLFELTEKGIQYGSMLQSRFYIEDIATPLVQDMAHMNVYAFRMKWGTNASVSDGFYSRYVGSYHGQTRDFLLGTYKHRMQEYSPDAVSSKNKKGRTALTTQMRAYLKNFMATGNPNGGTLPIWTTWNPAPGVVKIMHFDAGLEKASSAMSNEMYDTTSILKLTKQNTSEAGYKALTESLWKGRFFMPAVLPDYFSL